ncbi:glycerophosphodiester phosphodiesterase [Lacinutrix undariae]
MKHLAVITLAVLALSCKQKQTEKVTDNTPVAIQKEMTYNFELQGHRGARGLAPENSIPAFKKALDLGVNTLELDVVITKDNKVLVSHEPWLNHTVTLDSLGQKITKETAESYNIYQHTYTETRSYDVGSTLNPLFPNQVVQKTSKPLLSDVIELAERTNPKILYNIEIKSTPDDETKGFQPNVKEFSDLLIADLKGKLPLKRVVIQSFDYRVLQYIHEAYPDYTLSYLTYKDDFKTNIETLGFVPQIYSPYYILATAEDVKIAHNSKVKVMPWTVNKLEDMKKMLAIGVDGIITDFPDVALPLRK